MPGLSCGDLCCECRRSEQAVLDLRTPSGLQGFRDASGPGSATCPLWHQRRESGHAVVNAFPLHPGWLYGGTVGTTVCNVVGSALKAVDVRTENATEDAAHLVAFCIKDKGEPCGDLYFSCNARRPQGHNCPTWAGERCTVCAGLRVMPSGRSAFSLLWRQLWRVVRLVGAFVSKRPDVACQLIKRRLFLCFLTRLSHKTMRTGSQIPTEKRSTIARDQRRLLQQVYPGGMEPRTEEKISEEQQATSCVELEEEHQDQHGEQEDGGDDYAKI
ncbi:sushi domain-containing protein 5 [Lates japonicus]|uniref:Sushi domain-containing protein 5 n=1 Tax=Lates japonicus TaxID=270547 RepID=A0AAD3NAJ0_LATJO|nr:sushi domain-containing protein 5 [Lates japonicus]